MKFEDYNNNPNVVKLAGASVLSDLEREAEAIQALPCPFCGGAPEARIFTPFAEYLSIGIVCSSCGVRTRYLMEGPAITGNTYTLTDRLHESAKAWNRRT